jgi:hypothetical protein
MKRVHRRHEDQGPQNSRGNDSASAGCEGEPSQQRRSNKKGADRWTAGRVASDVRKGRMATDALPNVHEVRTRFDGEICRRGGGAPNRQLVPVYLRAAGESRKICENQPPRGGQEFLSRRDLANGIIASFPWRFFGNFNGTSAAASDCPRPGFVRAEAPLCRRPGES